jgi:hypothetical protein
LLQLRYGPSGSKAVPGHEQGLVTRHPGVC